MAHRASIRRYGGWYARLLRLYSKPYYERFGEGMEQTFSDLLRERSESGRGLFGCALWVFVETSVGIARENSASIIMRNKNILVIALATAILLLIPLVAMQFTDEVVWTFSDFVVAGALLFGAGVTYDLITRRAGNIVYRSAVGLAVGTALFLVWANLAVGLIGSENNSVNLMYLGVLAVGIVGTILARLKPQAMSRALLATALAQMLVAVIALIAGMQHDPESSVSEILGVNVFFGAMFVFSALLFRHAKVLDSR